jgi:hypothetical protein
MLFVLRHLPLSVLAYIFMKVKRVKQSRYTALRRLGEKMYRSYSFMTLALERGEWSASRSGRLYPRYPLYRGLGGP